MDVLNKDKVISYLEEFKRKHSKKYHILKLGLFGSFTRNEMNEHSDIDIVVELEKPKMFDVIGIKQELEEAFTCPVDIVSMRKNMNKFLKARIERDAIFV
jgi:predicted nucleotidyltransferase